MHARGTQHRASQCMHARRARTQPSLHARGTLLMMHAALSVQLHSKFSSVQFKSAQCSAVQCSSNHRGRDASSLHAHAHAWPLTGSVGPRSLNGSTVPSASAASCGCGCQTSHDEHDLRAFPDGNPNFCDPNMFTSVIACEAQDFPQKHVPHVVQTGHGGLRQAEIDAFIDLVGKASVVLKKRGAREVSK